MILLLGRGRAGGGLSAESVLCFGLLDFLGDAVSEITRPRCGVGDFASLYLPDWLGKGNGVQIFGTRVCPRAEPVGGRWVVGFEFLKSRRLLYLVSDLCLCVLGRAKVARRPQLGRVNCLLQLLPDVFVEPHASLL